MPRASSDASALSARPVTRFVAQKFPSAVKGKALATAIPVHEFYTKRAEKDGLVRLKHNDEYPQGSGKGVGDPLFRLATASLVNYPEFGFNPNIEAYSIARKGEDGRWMAYPVEHVREDNGSLTVRLLGAKAWAFEEGKRYIYVTMPDNTIRVAQLEDQKNSHFRLAGSAPYVLCAGEVFFDDRMPSRCNPMSGTYIPEDHALQNAGFGCALVGGNGQEVVPTELALPADFAVYSERISYVVVTEPTRPDSPLKDQEALQ
ncbi:MAG: hypothetical protein ACREX0_00745 [Noviherbaspirillum sp.]